jgi:hypothetical protein
MFWSRAAVGERKMFSVLQDENVRLMNGWGGSAGLSVEAERRAILLIA